MLVHNQIDNLPSYLDIIKDQFQKACKVDLVISYVQQSGVGLLKGPIIRMIRNGFKVRLVCSFDMEITDPLAIKMLMDMGVEVKIHHPQRGTLHAKQWMFESSDGKKNCIIGSANLSEAALRSNVETGILITSEHDQKSINQARNAFDFIWKNKDSTPISDKDIATWIQTWNEKEKLKKQLRNFAKHYVQPDRDIDRKTPEENVSILENYVKNWIDIGVNDRTSGSEVTGRLWRGWYIIPDQGYIDDTLMEHLYKVCVIISHAPENTIDISSEMNQPFGKILELKKASLVRTKRKMNLRDLFVRREKNYLQRFDFAEHSLKPNGKINQAELKLTETGVHFAHTTNPKIRKRIYSRSMQEYSYNNLYLLRFLYEILTQVQTLSFVEFSFFVSHAYSFDQMDDVVALINIYRSLSPEVQQRFETSMSAYFKEKLEPTAQNVRGNYDKKVKHTMSALGWCQKLQYDAKGCELRLTRR